jgi:hypothetical protein
VIIWTEDTAAGAKVPASRPQETASVVKELPAGTQPDPEWIRGTCPCCGSPVVSNAYHVGGHPGGYVILHECWQSLGEAPTCRYRVEFLASGERRVLGVAPGH